MALTGGWIDAMLEGIYTRFQNKISASMEQEAPSMMVKVILRAINPQGRTENWEFSRTDESAEDMHRLVDEIGRLAVELVGRGYTIIPFGENEYAPSRARPPMMPKPQYPAAANEGAPGVLDERDLPIWFEIEGRRAWRVDGECDIWYMVRMPNGEDVPIMRIPKIDLGAKVRFC